MLPLKWHLQVCLEYLERYYVLIAFTAYLFEPGFNPESHHQASLAHWMKRRPELYRLALLPAISITSSHTSAAGMYMYAASYSVVHGFPTSQQRVHARTCTDCNVHQTVS